MKKRISSLTLKCTNCLSYVKRVLSQVKKVENVFCSQSCAATFNNKKRAKIKCCLNCQNTLKKSWYTFCGHACQHEYSFLKTVIPEIEKGLRTNPAILKKYLSTTRGYKCELCNLTIWQNNPLVLELDHINGDSDNCRPSNIRLLCPNCHSQTKTFGFKGKMKKSKRCLYKRQYLMKTTAA